MYDLLLTAEGRRNVKVYVSCVWVILLTAIINGSMLWIKECFEIFMDGEWGL